MKKQTKEQKILALLAKGKSVKDIIKEVGGKPPYIYYVRWKHENKNKPIDKPRKKPIFRSQRSKDIQKIFQMAKLAPSDIVNSPPHYKSGGIETIDFIESKDLNYRLGNVIKYVTRAGRKADSDPLVDLKKARWYLDREIFAREGA